MEAYARIAERGHRNRKYGISRYPYEAGPAVGAFIGGFFEHREWPLRKGMEKHQSMRAVSEYECKYVNAAGDWAAFHHAAYDLREEALDAKERENAKMFDVWSYIAVRYNLRVLGLRTEFYKMAAEDPTYAKMIFPGLERRGDVAAADDLTETLSQLESHMNTQIMKAVVTLSASNATKRAKGNGAAADKN